MTAHRIPKRHHYVPRVILRRFVDDDGWLHYYSAREPNPAVRRARIENVFVEGHLYSQIQSDGSKDPSVEFALNRLETCIEPIIQKLERAAEAGKTPGLTAWERRVWDYFFLIQWRRVPDLDLVVATDDEVSVELAQIRHDLKQRFPNRAAEIDAFGQPEQERVLIHNARAQAVDGISKPILDALQRRGIALLRVTAPRKSLIIGSRPIAQFQGPACITPMGEVTEMWLPISTMLAVGIGRQASSEAIFDLCDHRLIRQLNVSIARQSTVVASNSPSLTNSIVNRR